MLLQSMVPLFKRAERVLLTAMLLCLRTRNMSWWSGGVDGIQQQNVEEGGGGSTKKQLS